MQALLEKRPNPEALPRPSTRNRLARAAFKLVEIIPYPSKRTVEKPTPEAPVTLADTGSHHIKNKETDLTVGKLQADLANEVRWKKEFEALLPNTAEEQKQRLYENAVYDPNVLVAPEPELKSRTITFSSKDEALLNTLHKNQPH